MPEGALTGVGEEPSRSVVNAMGRAGRGGKETEGWIVLVRAAKPTTQDIHDLDPDAEGLAVTSSLITNAVLESFAEFDAQVQADEDAIFTAAADAADFISFVWLILAIEESRGIDPGAVDLNRIVTATLPEPPS